MTDNAATNRTVIIVTIPTFDDKLIIATVHSIIELLLSDFATSSVMSPDDRRDTG